MRMDNDCPKHLWRFPTREAIDSLAARFKLPNDPGMQDWEYEVADAKRINEFISAYLSGELTEDEKFTLMATIIQSFADMDQPLANDERWPIVIRQLEANIDLHIYTVWYWSSLSLESEDESDMGWNPVIKSIRNVLDKYRDEYA
jgi:hypothetical protein